MTDCWHPNRLVPPAPAGWLTLVVIRWRLLVVLASLAAVAPVATDLYLPGFPAMATAFGTDASGVQLTLTSFLVGLAFGQLVMGPVSDRYGRRGPLVASAAVCVVAGVVCAVAPNLAVLGVARLAQGFAGAGGMVIGRAIIADLVTGRAAAKAFTLMLTVGGVAPVLAPLVGGLLAGPVGWRGMLWAVAILCAAMLVGVVLVVEETHPASRRTRSGESPIAGLRVVLGTRSYRGR
jgi:DHA1 family bicyclomycin/chloramphenicol resistance-like MFS transporter